jgi:hypothetical protein
MKKLFTFSLLLILSAFCLKAQTPRTVIIEPNKGFLDDMIMADTLANGQRKDLNTVYVLRRNATYLIQGVFENKGWTLNIAAEAGTGKKPNVRPYPMVDGTLNSRLFTLSGAGKFENIYFDGEDLDAVFKPVTIIFYSSYEGLKLELEGCIIANAGQAGIQIFKATEYLKVNNCRFFNMGRMAFNDFGNGRVLDARDTQFGLISFTNSTFINNVDRVIRHRNSTGKINQLVFDHNTIINSFNYHGFMELGFVGKSVQITNNLAVDCMGLGADQTDVTRLSELNQHTEKDASGNPKMVWVGSVPNDTTIFTISNNVYTITTAQQAWYTSVGLTEGPILTNHIQTKLGAGAATAWQKKNFTLANIPAPAIDFYKFYWAPTPNGAGKTKMTTTVVDYDKKNTDYWMNTLNCKYSVTDQAFRGKDGVPVGDPSWGSVVTGIAERRNSGFELVSFPNPFSDYTTLKFMTEQYAEVKIEIFDITGKAVRQIDAGTFTPGENTFVIQRSNMISGIYILKLNAGRNSSFSKLVVR